MINGLRIKNVRLIILCTVCILALAATILYAALETDNTAEKSEESVQEEGLAYVGDVLPNGMSQVQSDLNAVSQEGNADMDSVSQEGNAGLDSISQEGNADMDSVSQEENGDMESVLRLEDVFKDKKLSILGDSISTYEGWIPDGYAEFFPMLGEVETVDETWWKMVMDDTGMQFCANSSSAGSTCVGDSTGIDDPKFACSNYRIDDLIGNGGVYPDIIIVYMGTNDLLTGVPLGENDGTQSVEEGMIETFSDAYTLILDKLESQYPGAQIFCCTLAQIGDWGVVHPFETFINSQGLSSEDYSRQIEIIAENRAFNTIDLLNCGITVKNMQKYVTDGVHLNTEGMKLVRDAVEASLMASAY